MYVTMWRVISVDARDTSPNGDNQNGDTSNTVHVAVLVCRRFGCIQNGDNPT